MKTWFLAAFTAVLAGMAAPARANPISLQQVHINIDGLTQDNLAGFNDGLNANGLGTLTYTDTKVGSDFLAAILDYELAAPFYNEYGTTVNGPAPAGETWSIDDWYDNSGSPTLSSGAQTNANDAFDQVDCFGGPCLSGNPLSDNNLLPGQLPNFSANCSTPASAHVGGSGANCNGDVAGALGFAYTVGAGQRAIVTLTASTSAPSAGFALKLVHPADATNPTETDVYLSGNATIQPIAAVPEPATLILLGTGVASTILRRRRKPDHARS
jgi:hypothetical protein